MRGRGAFGVLAASATALLIMTGTASAATLNVNVLNDELNMDGDCSLREAVEAANTNSIISGCMHNGMGGTDTIQLIAGTFTLTGASGEDMNMSGDLDIEGNGAVVINGAPIDANEQPTSIVDANSLDRVFHVESDAGEGVDLSLLALGVRNGNTTSDGGGLLVSDVDAVINIDTTIWQSNDAVDYGGAVNFDNATVDAYFRVEQSEFASNTAGEEGGGFYLDMPDLSGDEPSIANSAFVANTAGEMGGAIYLGTRPTFGILLDILNTTISGNSAMDGGGALAFDLSQDGNAYMSFVTVANNTSATPGSAGGIQTVPPAGAEDQFVLLNRSIIAGNTAAGSPANCVGPGNVQGGFTVESTNSCGLTLANSMVNTDPQLAPLATNAGGEQTTRTHGLYDTSPAVNFFAASMMTCAGVAEDQRYSLRPAGAGCDVGAFEGTVGPAPAGPATPVTPATPAKKCKKKKKKKKRSAAAAKKKKGCKKKKKKK